MPFSSDKIKQFKNGVLEESKNILVLKYQAGFLSNQMCFEGFRVIETFGDKYLAVIREYAEKNRDHQQKVLDFWSEGLYNVSPLLG